MTVGSKSKPDLPLDTRVEVKPGDASWEQVRPLFDAVWPAELRATFSWAHVVWVNAQQRVLLWNGAGDLICHVGSHFRQATWTERPVGIGGIGGVITRQDARKQGHASAAIRLALAQLKDGGADFALLFCEPHNFDFYRRLGWQPFAGDVYCEQRQGRVRFDAMAAFVFDMRLSPRDGTIDLCGRPW